MSKYDPARSMGSSPLSAGVDTGCPPCFRSLGLKPRARIQATREFPG